MRSLALALMFSAAPVSAAEGPGLTAAPVLQIPLGSRALGMGSAFTAVASDVSALHYNPAGLSRLNAHEMAFTFITGLADNNVQHGAYGGPLPFAGLSGNGYSSLGASVLYAQSGTIEVNRTAADGSFLSSQNLSAGTDLVAHLGYAERVGTTPLEFGNGRHYGLNHFLGVSGKFVRSTLVETYEASAFSGDAGYLINSPEAGVTFGMSVLNIGGKLRYIEEADPLPTTMRAGLAYQGGLPSLHAFTLASDAEYLAKERQMFVNAGAEYFWLRTFGARLGYQFLRDAVGLTAGFGLRWRSRVMIDYAWTMGRGLNDSHRFTLSYRFGGVAPAARAKPRRPYIEASPDKERLRGLEESTPIPADPPARSRPSSRPERGDAVPGWIY